MLALIFGALLVHEHAMWHRTAARWSALVAFSALTIACSGTGGAPEPAARFPVAGDEIIAELETAMRAGLADPAVRAQLDEAYVPGEFIGAEEFRSMLDEIVEVYGPVAEELRGG